MKANAQEELVCVFRDRLKVRPGETIKIIPDPAQIHLFDAENGTRLIH